MPEMEGPAALEKMLTIKPGLRAIFTRGYTAEADSVRSMIDRGTLLLQKPYDSKDLAQSVRSLLDESV
jgi:DNA-binding NtrC family response regulator